MKIKYLIFFCLIFSSIQAKKVAGSAASIKTPSKLMQFTQKYKNPIIAGLVTGFAGVGTVFGVNFFNGSEKSPTVPPQEPTAPPTTLPAQSEEGVRVIQPRVIQPQVEESSAEELERLLTILAILENTDRAPSRYNCFGYQQADEYFKYLPGCGKGRYKLRCGIFSIANILADFFPDCFLSCDLTDVEEIDFTKDPLAYYHNVKLLKLDGHSQKDHKERSCQMLRVLIPGFNLFVQKRQDIKNKNQGVDQDTFSNSLALFVEGIYLNSGFSLELIPELIIDHGQGLSLKDPLQANKVAYILNRIAEGAPHWFVVVFTKHPNAKPAPEYFDSIRQQINYEEAINNSLASMGLEVSIVDTF